MKNSKKEPIKKFVSYQVENTKVIKGGNNRFGGRKFEWADDMRG